MRYDDGVPERTLKDIIEEQSRKLAALAGVTGGDVPPIQLQQVMEDAMPRVRCIDTGEEFDTVSDAERAKGIGINTLGAAIRRSGQCKGLHWEFLDKPASPAADSASGIESNPAGVSTKTRRMAKLRRIAPAPALPPPAPTPVDPPARVLDSPPPAEALQGKLRVRFMEVECDGGALASVVEQIASIIKR